MTDYTSRSRNKVMNRSELKACNDQLRRWNAEYRKQIAELKKQIAVIEEILKQFDASKIDDVDALCQISTTLEVNDE
jgi:hypothetical protein